MSAPDERRPQYAKCINCRHRWVVAYVPMELVTFARVIGCAHCPSCGADSKRIELHDPPARERE